MKNKCMGDIILGIAIGLPLITMYIASSVLFQIIMIGAISISALCFAIGFKSIYKDL